MKPHPLIIVLIVCFVICTIAYVIMGFQAIDPNALELFVGR